MASLSKAIIIGNVGKDPEMRYTPSGVPITQFSVATNRTLTDNDGNQKTLTDWFRIVAWKRQAELCNEYLSKGKKVYVEGSLHIREYTDDKGLQHRIVEITAEKILFLSPSDQTEKVEGEPANSDEI